MVRSDIVCGLDMTHYCGVEEEGKNSLYEVHNTRFSSFFIVCSCLKIRYLDVPQVAQSGHDVSLTCDYDLERQRLYSVKWYKGSHEFYRFTPGDPEKLRLFLVENLHIDVSTAECELRGRRRTSVRVTVCVHRFIAPMSGAFTSRTSMWT